MLERSGSLVTNLARKVALLGGLILLLIAVVTLISVVGRALLPLGLKPLRGQFELVEAGTLFVISAFLPWCHLKRGHAAVAIFTDHLGPRFNALIDLVSDVLLLGVALIVTWRHLAGLLDKMAYGETTFLLRFPLWWSYSAALIGLSTWILVGLWTSANSAHRLFSARPGATAGAGN